MTDNNSAPELLEQLRPIRDRLGKHGDLFMRLSGFYRIGSDGPAEPEFGYRDVRDSEFRQPIQLEAAQALADLCAADRGGAEKSDDWRKGFEVGWDERLKQERHNAAARIEVDADALEALKRENEAMREALQRVTGLYQVTHCHAAARAALASREAPPAVTVQETPTAGQLYDACMSYRHDFGLLEDDQRKSVEWQAREWWRCIARALGGSN